MGLLSSIKKGLKKIGSALGKVFKPILKPFRKLLSNKWVRGLLMATTLFTGIGAVMAGFQAGGLMGAGSALAKFAVNSAIDIVKTPFQLISGGLKAIGGLASGVGADSLGNFVSSLGQGLGDRVNSIADAGKNIFANAVTPGAAPNGLTQPPTAPGVQSPAPANPMDRVTPDPMQRTGQTLDTAPTGAPTPQGMSAAVTSNAPPAKPSLLSRAAGWVKENPELTKMGVDAVAGMTAPDEYSEADAMRDRDALWRNAGAEASASTGKPRQGLLESLRERNQELFEQARASSSRLMNVGANTPVNFVR